MAKRKQNVNYPPGRVLIRGDLYRELRLAAAGAGLGVTTLRLVERILDERRDEFDDLALAMAADVQREREADAA